MRLRRVTAFVCSQGMGINDDLNGVETVICVKDLRKTAEVVHSLAKWKNLHWQIIK